LYPAHVRPPVLPRPRAGGRGADRPGDGLATGPGRPLAGPVRRDPLPAASGDPGGAAPAARGGDGRGRARPPSHRRPAGPGRGAQRMSGFDAISVGRRVLGDEARALSAQAEALDAAFATAVDTLFAAKGRIICTGIGKSGHVARKIAATFASTGTPAMFVHAAEASHGDLGMIGADDVILC